MAASLGSDGGEVAQLKNDNSVGKLRYSQTSLGRPAQTHTMRLYQYHRKAMSRANYTIGIEICGVYAQNPDSSPSDPVAYAHSEHFHPMTVLLQVDATTPPLVSPS